jgi:heparan-alpha-glucosaminide N-acetyltransferase
MNSPQESDPGRLRSVDTFRGFVMLAMVSGGIATFGCLSRTGDGEMSIPLEILLQQLDHVQWRGCFFWDLIQPSFMFLVGVSMPLSYSRRRARGDSWLQLFGHAVLRSLVLVALAVFLASHGGSRTDYSFTNVLGQIGLGYCFVFLVLGRPPWFQLAAALLILLADWLLFALYPLPGPKFPYGLFGATEPQLMMRGFFAHWNKNTNVAAEFDRWFLNLFPRLSSDPFRFNPGGYATLNFIPSIATMIFGVLAGELLKSRPGQISKPRILLLAGALLWVLGQVLDGTVCPIVKRIWTPSWVIASSAWTCWMLAAFYWVIDERGFKFGSLPLAAVGANSIAIYLMSQLMRPFVEASLKTHVDKLIFVGPYGPLVKGLSVLAVLWFICLWLFNRKIFFKI